MYRTKQFDENNYEFNSKSKNYYKLSNFFGGVEACYMKDRFKNTEIKEYKQLKENGNKDTEITKNKKSMKI